MDKAEETIKNIQSIVGVLSPLLPDKKARETTARTGEVLVMFFENRNIPLDEIFKIQGDVLNLSRKVLESRKSIFSKNRDTDLLTLTFSGFVYSLSMIMARNQNLCGRLGWTIKDDISCCMSKVAERACHA